jgi:hypothetical protein
MTATITNHIGALMTGQIRCWMGRRIVEIETPDGTRHIGHLIPDPNPTVSDGPALSTVDGVPC